MPFPLLPVLGLAAGLYTSHKARQAQKKQNQQDRTFQSNMYNRNVADNRQDFATANAYNSPEEQMNRLRQAGLNPHLVYGKGAANTAAMVKNSSGSAPNQVAPSPVDVQGALANYAQLRHIQAQTDNVQENTQLQRTEQLLKAAQTSHETQKGHLTKFDLELQRELRDVTIDRAKLENRNIESNTQLNLNRDDRERIANSTNVAKTLQDILESKKRIAKTDAEINRIDAMIDKTKNENEIIKLDLELRKMGINPNDEIYWRLIGQYLNHNPETPEKRKERIKRDKNIQSRPFSPTQKF